jgi:hypothetical protein
MVSSLAGRLARILSDLRSVGAIVFERFTTKKEGTLWYYGQLAQVFLEKLPGPLANELRRVVSEIDAADKALSRYSDCTTADVPN